jgi:hypothetical protein
MGILQQMVHVLGKLDPHNTHWSRLVLEKSMQEFEEAEKETDEDKLILKEEIFNTFDTHIQFPDYTRKLYLIENCIYGVDIQSIAVQISKLRFFISLICEQKRNSNPEMNYGIRPLPNLETKFVAANTLIGIEKPEEDVQYLKEDQINHMIKRLNHLRHRQFSVTNAQKKKELRKKDEALRHDIVNEVARLYKLHADENLNRYKMQLKLAEKELEFMERVPDDIRTTTSTDLFGNETSETFNFTEKRRKELRLQIKMLNNNIEAGSNYSRLNSVVRLAEQLTSWNPYDQNNHSEFFDPEWMFGLKPDEDGGGYFDVVIGNPPYVDSKKLKHLSPIFKKSFETYSGASDIYVYFYELGIKILRLNGIINLITSNKWIRSEYGRNLRKFFLNKTKPLQLLDFGTSRVFDATVDCNILMVQRDFNKSNLKICNATEGLSGKLIHEYFKDNFKDEYELNENAWLTKTGKVENIENIKRKIERNGISLKNHGIEIFRGILTGLNNAFIVDEQQKNALSTNEATKLIFEPIIKGKNIEKYFYTYDNLYLINSHNGNKSKNIEPINLKKDHNQIYKWLESFLPAIDERTDKGLHWSNLRNCAYLSEFKKEKIIYQGIAKRIMFSYDQKGVFCDVTTFFMTGKNLKYILGILNSKFFEYVLLNIYLEGDTFKSKNQILQQFPIPNTDFKHQKQLIELVEQILSQKEVSSINIENQIDILVYRLYDLTYSEIKVIDPEIEGKISEEEYIKFDMCEKQ